MIDTNEEDTNYIQEEEERQKRDDEEEEESSTSSGEAVRCRLRPLWSCGVSQNSVHQK